MTDWTKGRAHPRADAIVREETSFAATPFAAI
jgi:hypothetical protein